MVHTVETYTSMGLVMTLFVASIILFVIDVLDVSAGCLFGGVDV